MKNILLITTCAVTLVSCVTNNKFTSFPIDNDYLLPKEELTKKYNEILEYEELWRGFSPNHPPEESLITNIGEPKSVETDWSYPLVVAGTLIALSAEPIVWLIALAIRPTGPEIYTFEKGNYCITTIMDNTIFTGYNSNMVSWKWEEAPLSCN